ncbi:sigma factor-like helix-turn-helix DNA-binding protein [Chromatium okenii]
MGITRERVRQIQIDAIKRLRDILNQEGFLAPAFLMNKRHFLID